MSEHMRIMGGLLNDRENRAIKRSVARISAAELKAELEARECSTVGSDASLRDRLLRAVMREEDRQRGRVPWYDWDADGGAPRTTPNLEGFIEPRTRKRGAGESRRVERTERVSRGTQTDSSGDEPTQRVQATKALIYRPVEVPVSTSSVTSCVTSAPRMTTSTMPMFTQSVLGKPYTVGQSGIGTQAYTPRLSINPDLRGCFEQIPRGWEYYLAERIRQVRAPAPEATVEKMQMITPATRRDREREWYTPMQEWDRIEPAPGDSAASGAQSNAESNVGDERAGTQPIGAPRESVRTSAPEGRGRLSAQEELARTLEFEQFGYSDTESEVGTRRDAPRGKPPQRAAVGRKGKDGFERRNGVEVRGDGKSRLKGNSIRGYSEGSGSELQRAPRRTSLVSAPRSGGRDQDARPISSFARSEPAIASMQGAHELNGSGPYKGYKERAVKLLKDFGLRFSGEDKGEDAEEFLDQLQSCRDENSIPDRDMIYALQCVLSKKARRWYLTMKSELRSWDDLRRAFRNQFVKEYDREDLLDDLRKRTQAKGETISNFITSLKYIRSRFAEPPTERSLVETAWRNLLPEYRRAMSDRLIDSLEILEEYGRRWERQKDLDGRYAPPPPAEKMHVPGAAFGGPSSFKARVSAVKETRAEGSEEEVAAINPTEKRKTKGGKGGSVKQEKREDKNTASGNADGQHAVEAVVSTRRTYANAVQTGQQSNNYARPPAEARNLGAIAPRWNGMRPTGTYRAERAPERAPERAYGQRPAVRKT